MVHDAIELGLTIQLLEGCKCTEHYTEINYIRHRYMQAAFYIVMKHNLTSDRNQPVTITCPVSHYSFKPPALLETRRKIFKAKGQRESVI